MMTMQNNIDVPYPNVESKDEIYTFLKWCSDNNATYEWNNWRIRNLLTSIDLSKLDLRDLRLDFIDFKSTNLSFCDFSHTSLEGVTFDIANLEGANLGYANLAEASLRNTRMLGTNLIGANLILANFEASDMTGAHLANANLTGANMERACLKGVSFENANLRNVNFKNADLRIALMLGVDLSTADLSNVNLTGANLTGVDLSVVDISTLNLTATNLTNANLCGIDFSNINLSYTILSGADMSECILNGVSLVGQEMIDTNLTSAELIGANLSEAKMLSIKGLGADFTSAIMLNCDLTNADLEGAILQSANMEGANLEGANLEGANIRATNLTDANLYGTDLTNAKLNGAILIGTHLEKMANANQEKAPSLTQNPTVQDALKDMESVNKIIDKPTAVIAVEEKLKEIARKNQEIEKARKEQLIIEAQKEELKSQISKEENTTEDIKEIEEIEKNINTLANKKQDTKPKEVANMTILSKEQPQQQDAKSQQQEIISSFEEGKITNVDQLLKVVSKISPSARAEDVYSIIKRIAFKLSYKDGSISGSDITMPYIEMLQAYQDNVYMTYLAFVGRREEITYLTKREKASLELKFKIDESGAIFIIPYKLDYVVKNMIECAIGPKEILLSVCAIIGYLPTKQIKKCIKDKIEDTDDTILETFVRVSRRLKNSEAKDKKIDVILKPITNDNSITLKIKEGTLTSKSISAKTTSKRMEEIEIEDEFLVDGVKGLSSRKSTFYLVNDEDTYEIKLSADQSAIKDKLLQSLRKTVSATIAIEKLNDEIVNQTIVSID